MFFHLLSCPRLFPDFIDGAFTVTASFAFNQCGADSGNFFRCFLFSDLTLADQFADNLTFITEMPCFNLCLDSAILLIGDGKAFFDHCHFSFSGVGEIFRFGSIFYSRGRQLPARGVTKLDYERPEVQPRVGTGSEIDRVNGVL